MDRDGGGKSRYGRVAEQRGLSLTTALNTKPPFGREAKDGAGQWRDVGEHGGGREERGRRGGGSGAADMVAYVAAGLRDGNIADRNCWNGGRRRRWKRRRGERRLFGEVGGLLLLEPALQELEAIVSGVIAFGVMSCTAMI
ncbi:plant invertase/pectin methylesterase inhibitor [Striga asiatica]|uniref:Plant invertase/pectin methylesterase inhibitor n=1 Tax=Striga asiatica TaxID=4170 RepID=A0A5A7Q4J9_STRAF|nr:plant invertase/pectin methylesterase inhibitor [Striga asiatica]